MAISRVAITPSVIQWARESAGLDIATSAGRLGVKAERVAAWEAGELDPTINQLRGMADIYERPLAALFMDEPLGDEPVRTLPDFRRPETRTSIAPRALQKAIMRAHRQRDALRETGAELDLPESDLVPRFVLTPDGTSEQNGARLRDALGIDSIPQATIHQPELLLRELVRRTEDLNVAVMQVQRVDVDEMRGFSLGDGTCAIVALNGADWPRGKIFTLLHELAHVGFRSNGLCDFQHLEDAGLERLCDEVTASALMPSAMFLAAVTNVPELITRDFARAVGAQFGCSAEAAVLRMIDLNLATWDDYWSLKSEFDEAYRTYKADEKERNAGKDSPIFYQVKARDIGRRFIRQMLFAHGENALSSRDLAQLLEVSYDKVPTLARTAGEDFS